MGKKRAWSIAWVRRERRREGEGQEEGGFSHNINEGIQARKGEDETTGPCLW